MDVDPPPRVDPAEGADWIVNYLFGISRCFELSGITNYAMVVNKDRTVLFARDFRTGEVDWPAAVNLIQALKARIPNPIISPNAPHACDGVAAFNNVTLMRQFPAPINAPPPIALNQQVDFLWGFLQKRYAVVTSPIEVNPATVLQRPELAAFTNLALGPAPNVNLFGKRETHLHRLYMMVLASAIHQRATMNQAAGHNIGALMVDNSGRVLARALNTRQDNPTYHAEVNLLQAIALANINTGQFPVIYTSLKPCKMCAALITATQPNSRVIYLQNDAGTHAQNTDAPGHGIHLLTDAGAAWAPKVKPVRVYDSLPSSRPQPEDMGQRLDSLYTAQWAALANDYLSQGFALPAANLTAFLRDREAMSTFAAGSIAFSRKVLKYEATHQQKDVARVVAHLRPLVPGGINP